MKTPYRPSTLSALTGLLAIAICPGLAWSEEKPLPEMSPTAAPYTKPESSLSVGAGYLLGDRQQLGIFDARDHTRPELLLDANIVRRDDATGTWSRAMGRNLGRDDNREATLEMERQGMWGVRLDYNEIPALAPYTANSKTDGLGTTTQIIPKSAIANNGNTYHIETNRERVTFNTFRTFNQKLKFNLNFRNETKEGTRQWGRGGAPEFVLEPVDWTMRQLEPSVSYQGRDLQWQFGYSGSWYHNDNNLVDTRLQGDNPATLANHYYLSLPLDNEAHQIHLSGGYQLPADTRITFKIAHGRALQNEHLPTADIAGLGRTGGLASLEGRVDTTHLLLGLSSRPLPDLHINAKLRYYDEADKTPAWLVAQTATAQVHSTPASLTTYTGLLEASYRLPFDTTVTAGVEHKKQDRAVPFGNDRNGDGMDDERFVPWRNRLDETTWRLQLARHLSETVNGTASVEHAVRTGSSFVDSPNILGTTQGKIVPFFIADRERDKLRIALDWRPIERLGVQLNAENALDHYDDQTHPYGMKKGHAQLYALDLDFAPTDKWLLTAWYAYDINRTWQDSGRWNTPTQHEADKSSLLTDTGSTLGLGVRNQWNEKLKLGANFQWTRTTSSFDDMVTTDPKSAVPAYPAGVTPLPTIVSPMTRLNAFFEYKGLGPGMLRWDYIHERWESNDWNWKFSDGTPFIYGTTTDSTQMATQDRQTADFIGVRYTTRFQ
ncbi:MAG: MtrB/PioB family decaheme-associated outer membrane protein [Magnetococcales bacterium]|nr:MtrB/PioB family decaheme-associated outer membrane protein [Magnetococcales bacterium]